MVKLHFQVAWHDISFIRPHHQKPVDTIQIVLYEVLQHLELFDLPAQPACLMFVIDALQLYHVHPVREVWHHLYLTHEEYHLCGFRGPRTLNG